MKDLQSLASEITALKQQVKAGKLYNPALSPALPLLTSKNQYSKAFGIWAFVVKITGKQDFTANEVKSLSVQDWKVFATLNAHYLDQAGSSNSILIQAEFKSKFASVSNGFLSVIETGNWNPRNSYLPAMQTAQEWAISNLAMPEFKHELATLPDHRGSNGRGNQTGSDGGLKPVKPRSVDLYSNLTDQIVDFAQFAATGYKDGLAQITALQAQITALQARINELEVISHDFSAVCKVRSEELLSNLKSIPDQPGKEWLKIATADHINSIKPVID